MDSEKFPSTTLPSLPAGWEYRYLEDLLEPGGLSYGIVQPGQDVLGGVPVVRVKNLRNGRIVSDDVLRVDRNIESKYQRTRLRGGEVLLTLVGSVGEVAVVSPSLSGWNVARAIGVIRLSREASSSWIKLSLLAKTAQGCMRIWQTNTVQATLNLRDVRRIPIAMPPECVRNTITCIAGALDDKIAVNEKIARHCLELSLSYARAGIPWSSSNREFLADHVEVTKGASYRSADLTPGAGWLVTLKCVGRNGSFQPAGLKPYSGECKITQIVEHGDIVIAQTDLTQRADVIGRPVRVESPDLAGRLVASLDLAVVRPGPLLSREFLLGLLSTQDFHDHAIEYCNGTTVLHLGARALSEFRFAMPDLETVEKITSLMRPLLSRSDEAKRENLMLAQLRDTLLPTLMSGELRVRDAEKVVEEAT